MSSSSIFIILAIVVYLVGMILIGYRHSKGSCDPHMIPPGSLCEGQ